MIGNIYRTAGIAAAALLVAFAVCSGARAADVRCQKCHGALTRGVSVHKALNMGCSSCHTGLDARIVPHRITNARPKGLSSEIPGLCYACHDRSQFERQDVHPALAMGCLTCHNPHASKNAMLLTAPVPALCFSCHDKAGFTRKDVHEPVAQGRCMACHLPHSSDQMALLAKRPIEVCTGCHKDTPHGTHFTPRKLRSEGTGTAPPPEPMDPKRPGKPFYCGSCHNPHSTDSPLLFRFKAQSVSELCKNCHEM